MMPGAKHSMGPYELLAPIGTGGMGEVFRARDTRLNREVAIKLLPKDFVTDPDRLRRFEQEAKTLAALSHPNVLTIFDTGVHEGSPYLVSELLEGKTLREELGASNGALPVRKATDYALQIAQGLSAAHSKGIIHRDLKPENIFITKDGRVKILDFGLAKLQSDLKSEISKLKSTADPDAPTLVASTQPGMVLGTPAYMSPEQVRGEPADHRSDLFAFGCVLYEMLSGTRAFRRDTPVESMHAILKDEPTALTERNAQLPPTLERIVQRCLEKLPENRFQSAKDLAFALSETSSLQALPGDWRAGLPSGGVVWKSALILGVIAITATLAFWRPWRGGRSFFGGASPQASNTIATDPARQPLIRAREVESRGHDASLDEMKLAVTLCQSVIDRNPGDGEAWALMARLNCNLYDNFDRTPERLNAAQGAARNALSLAQTSIAAHLAEASVYGLQRATYSQSLDMLRRLAQDAPNDPDVFVTLGNLLVHGEQTPEWGETMRLLDRALALRPNDPVALNDKAWALSFMGKADEADKLWDECIRRTGNPGAMTAKFYDLAWNRGKIEEAKALLERFPSDLVFNDTAVRLVAAFWLIQREPAKGLAYIEPFPREFIVDHFSEIPKGYLVGKLHAQAGQLAVAQLEWRKALEAVNKKLAAEPEQPRLIYYKTLLHSLLGEKDEAARQAEVFDQLSGPPRNRSEWSQRLSIAMELGRTEVALSIIRGDLRKYASPAELAGTLQRCEAFFPAVGSTPEFKAELASVQAEVARSESSHSASSPSGANYSASTNSVAVLPFVNLSPDKADEYLSDGMTEELLNALSRVEGLRVPGRSSSFAFKGKTEEDLFRKVGEQLHVGTVLEGSLRKAGNQLRITTRLIKVVDGFPLWSEEYDRDMTNIFALQSDIAGRVAEALKVRLLSAGAQSRKPTENIEAYKLYLQGRQLWNQRTGPAILQAVGYFQRAIARDPTYSLAYAGLADCYAILGEYAGMPALETAPKAQAAARKAIELDNQLAEPHATLGVIRADEWDWAGAEAEFRRALELNPNYATAHHWYGLLLRTQNRFPEAVAQLRRAREIDPLSRIFATPLAMNLFLSGDEKQAVEVLKQQLAFTPDFAPGHETLGEIWLMQGKLSEAIQELETAYRLDPDYSVTLGRLGFGYARAGRPGDAEQILARLLDLQNHGREVEPAIALIYHGLSKDEEALKWLAQAVENHSDIDEINYLPLWNDLRLNPRVQGLLRKMHLVK